MALPIVGAYSPCPEVWVGDEYPSPSGSGSEVNIIRRGLIGPSHTTAFGPEIHFCLVNKQSLGRNHRRLSCDIILSGVDQDKGFRVEVRSPIRAFDAPIDVGMILSYEWLARQNPRVYPRKHGLLFDQESGSVWVAVD